MQFSEGDDLSSQVLTHFTKNASYTGNYHEKYYYTELVHKRVVARRLRENERRAKSAHSKRDPDSAERVQRSGSLPSAAAATSGSQVGGTCSWYLVTGEQSRLSGDTAPYGLLQDTGSGELGADVRAGSIVVHREASARDMADKDEQLSPAAAAVGSWERVERSSGSGVNSSESVTSEDSVFSEDYTAMTDIAEPRNSCSGQPTSDDLGTRRRAPLELADDVDSSFSSPGSSTSTLEADGKEDGGGLEDKDKVVVASSSSSSSSPPLSHRTRPDIRLLLGQPIADVDDDDSPSPPTSTDRRPNEDDADGDVDGSMKKSESNSFYEDREFDFLKAEPVRRSTSLKTYKTPPGTPHRKKAVRFADALGLDLESVRHILNLEEPPEVPKSAMRDLVVGIQEEHRTDGVKYLSALFSQPGVDPTFLRRVRDGKVVLENCVVDDKDMTISGTIRVANVAYQKLVVVRYTTNGWLSSEDVDASYVQNSNDGPTDRFAFTINVPKYFAVGQRLEFALMYAAGGATYWDNNYGKNYVIECYARAMPVSESDNTWMHFL